MGIVTMPNVRPHDEQSGGATPGQATEALLSGVLAAAKAAVPEGLDSLVWGASRVGDQATLRHLLSIGGGSSWAPSNDDERWGRDSSLQQQGEATAGQATEALLAGVLAAAKAALPEGLDSLVWGACRVGDQATLRHLLSIGGATSWTPSNNDELWGRDTCLGVASRFSHEGAVKELLESGADVDEGRADTGVTPLYLAAQEGHEGVTEQLVEAGADLDKAKTDNGITPLWIAAKNGHEGVTEQLLKAGADVNKARTDNGSTPLYIAAELGYEGSVEQLLKGGADVNKAATDNGSTPLFMAAWNRREVVVEQLLKAGADVNKAITDGGITPLYMVAEEGFEELVDQLLKAGADINKARTDNGETPLHTAAEHGFEGVVEQLLKAGADVNKASDGTTPLLMAADEGHLEVVEQLLKAGAVPDTEPNPLIMASLMGHTRICSLLLEAGANVHHTTNDDPTSLELAVKEGHRDVALVLMEHGASSSGENMTRPMLKDLNRWMAEALQENKRVIAEKDRQMAEMVQGIPEWCAQAASAVLADEGKNGCSGSNSAPAQPQAESVARKRKAPTTAE